MIHKIPLKYALSVTLGFVLSKIQSTMMLKVICMVGICAYNVVFGGGCLICIGTQGIHSSTLVGF